MAHRNRGFETLLLGMNCLVLKEGFCVWRLSWVGLALASCFARDVLYTRMNATELFVFRPESRSSVK